MLRGGEACQASAFSLYGRKPGFSKKYSRRGLAHSEIEKLCLRFCLTIRNTVEKDPAENLFLFPVSCGERHGLKQLAPGI